MDAFSCSPPLIYDTRKLSLCDEGMDPQMNTQVEELCDEDE